MNNNHFYVNNNILATKGQRFLNYIIDIIMITLFLFIFEVIFLIIGELTGIYGIEDFMVEEENTLLEYLIFYVASILYYTIFEGFLSRSIAKYITNTQVVMGDGSKPDFETIFKRSLCRLIPFEHFSFLGSDSKGWHDSISKTFVVDRKLFESFKNKTREINEIESIGTKED